MKIKVLIPALLILTITSLSIMARTPVLSFINNMFNQISIKPQEANSMATFPIGAVSTDGREINDPYDRFSWLIPEMTVATSTANPFSNPQESLTNGKLKFSTYCIVCHGDTTEINIEGFAKTKVNELGMVAPAVIALTPDFTDGYIYNKIKYGGAVMPPLGYATTSLDRWDIVNYIRKLEKQR